MRRIRKKGWEISQRFQTGVPVFRIESLYFGHTGGTGKLTRQKFVELACTMPAKVVSLYPQKGELAAGSDADIVIFDPDYEGVIRNEDSLHGIDYNSYEGFEIKGRLEKVYLRGKLVAEKGRFVGEKGKGR